VALRTTALTECSSNTGLTKVRTASSSSRFRNLRASATSFLAVRAVVGDSIDSIAVGDSIEYPFHPRGIVLSADDVVHTIGGLPQHNATKLGIAVVL